MANIEGQKIGVGALIINPNDPEYFLAVQESNTNRSTRKLRGMLSAPFETIERGESHREALSRMINDGENGGEEISVITGKIIIPGEIEPSKLCEVDFDDRVKLVAYLLEGTTDLRITGGRYPDVIGDPQWVKIDDVLDTFHYPEWFRFRPGMIEIVESYKRYSDSRGTFSPGIFPQVRLQIPDYSYALIDSGVNLEEFLNQQAYLPQPQLTDPALSHLR